MPLPITIPNTFANATATIPLSQLDNNFSTVAVAVNSIGNGAFTLANVQVTGGKIANVVLDNVSVDVETLSNVTITNLTVNGNATFTNAAVTANTATITTANVTTANVTNMVTGNVTITGGTINVASVIATDDVTVGDDLVFTGTGNRITGDFSNATIANRVMFQSSTTNGQTSIGVLPNGTGGISSVNLFGTTDPANASLGQLATTTTEVRLQSGITGTGTYQPMTFFTGGSERMRVDTSGNVGIGTTSPSTRLTVSSSGANGLDLAVDQGNAVASARLFFSNGTAGQGYSISNDTGSLKFNRAATAGSSTGTESMRIDSSGNVGIGTSSPSTALQVAGTVTATAFSGSASGLTGIPAPAALTTASGSAPSYSARAWVNFNGTGTPAIRASGNVSSITDNSTGNYGVNFTTAMPDANYATQLTGESATAYIQGTFLGGTYSTTAVQVRFYNGSINSADPTNANVTIFR